MNIPIIRLEVEGMKMTISAAISEHAMQIEQDISRAVEDYCTPENISFVVRQAATNQLNHAIKEEVERFFKFGEGRKAVAEAVREFILNNKTYTPLDEL